VKKSAFYPGQKKTVPGKVIGVSTPRSEGPDKVSGRAIYATDVVLPGMLWAKALRSPIPYGRIKKIDTRRALTLPGVRAVATGEDVKGLLIGRKIYDMPILAHGVVRFIGEKLAAVAAESEAIAEEALELIEVEYEQMEPLRDPLAALKHDAPLLHPQVQHYRGLLHPIERPSNVFVDMTWKKAMWRQGSANPTLSSKTHSRPNRCTRPISSRTHAWWRRAARIRPKSGRVPKFPLRSANKSPPRWLKI
jgi:CO/xanthine dehydrogenase Mo-binding subunit